MTVNETVDIQLVGGLSKELDRVAAQLQALHTQTQRFNGLEVPITVDVSQFKKELKNLHSQVQDLDVTVPVEITVDKSQKAVIKRELAKMSEGLPAFKIKVKLVSTDLRGQARDLDKKLDAHPVKVPVTLQIKAPASKIKDIQKKLADRSLALDTTLRIPKLPSQIKNLQDKLNEKRLTVPTHLLATPLENEVKAVKENIQKPVVIKVKPDVDASAIGREISDLQSLANFTPIIDFDQAKSEIKGLQKTLDRLKEIRRLNIDSEKANEAIAQVRGRIRQLENSEVVITTRAKLDIHDLTRQIEDIQASIDNETINPIGFDVGRAQNQIKAIKAEINKLKDVRDSFKPLTAKDVLDKSLEGRIKRLSDVEEDITGIVQRATKALALQGDVTKEGINRFILLSDTLQELGGQTKDYEDAVNNIVEAHQKSKELAAQASKSQQIEALSVGRLARLYERLADEVEDLDAVQDEFALGARLLSARLDDASGVATKLAAVRRGELTVLRDLGEEYAVQVQHLERLNRQERAIAGKKLLLKYAKEQEQGLPGWRKSLQGVNATMFKSSAQIASMIEILGPFGKAIGIAAGAALALGTALLIGVVKAVDKAVRAMVKAMEKLDKQTKQSLKALAREWEITKATILSSSLGSTQAVAAMATVVNRYLDRIQAELANSSSEMSVALKELADIFFEVSYAVIFLTGTVALATTATIEFYNSVKDLSILFNDLDEEFKWTKRVTQAAQSLIKLTQEIDKVRKKAGEKNNGPKLEIDLGPAEDALEKAQRELDSLNKISESNRAVEKVRAEESLSAIESQIRARTELIKKLKDEEANLKKVQQSFAKADEKQLKSDSNIKNVGKGTKAWKEEVMKVTQSLSLAETELEALQQRQSTLKPIVEQWNDALRETKLETARVVQEQEAALLVTEESIQRTIKLQKAKKAEYESEKSGLEGAIMLRNIMGLNDEKLYDSQLKRIKAIELENEKADQFIGILEKRLPFYQGLNDLQKVLNHLAQRHNILQAEGVDELQDQWFKNREILDLLEKQIKAAEEIISVRRERGIGAEEEEKILVKLRNQKALLNETQGLISQQTKRQKLFNEELRHTEIRYSLQERVQKALAQWDRQAINDAKENSKQRTESLKMQLALEKERLAIIEKIGDEEKTLAKRQDISKIEEELQVEDSFVRKLDDAANNFSTRLDAALEDGAIKLRDAIYEGLSALSDGIADLISEDGTEADFFEELENSLSDLGKMGGAGLGSFYGPLGAVIGGSLGQFGGAFVEKFIKTEAERKEERKKEEEERKKREEEAKKERERRHKENQELLRKMLSINHGIYDNTTAFLEQNRSVDNLDVRLEVSQAIVNDTQHRAQVQNEEDRPVYD